jgi:fluoride exporter
MRLVLLIALGSALGGVARYWLSGVVASHVGELFPWGTLAVNVLGSALIGLLAGLSDSARMPLSADVRGFLMVGVMGGFTTFSSFSLQTLQRLQDGDWWRAGANVVASVVLCLLAAWAGYALARALE